MADLKKKVEFLTAPKREGMKVTSKWEVPSACLKSGAKDTVRFDGLDMLWVFDANPKTAGIKKGKGDVLARDNTNKNSQKSDTESISRKSFYPFKGKPKLLLAEFWVRGYNNQSGKRHYGPWVHSQLAFAKPAKPSVGISYNPSTGVGTLTYETEHPTGAREVYDTLVTTTVNGEKKVSNGAYTNLVKSFAYEVPSASNLGIGVFRKLTITAQNRGFYGASDKAAKSYYVFHPNPPVCGKPSLVYATNGVLSTAMVRVPVTNVGYAKDGSTVIRPTQVKLQRLKNSTSATDADGAAAASGWADVDTDNGTTSGMSDTWANGVSDEGKYTWYRAVAIRDGYETPGKPVQAKCLDVLASSTATGRAKIDSLTPGADGTSLIAALSGKQLDDDGYEVSWSDASDAWDSTKPPEVFDTAASSLVIKGLTEGTVYYARARAFDYDASGNKIYGQYSDTVSATPITTPSAVVLNVPEVTPRGSDIIMAWTYDTTAPQTAWRLVDSNGKVAYSGIGPVCSYAITPDMYGDASALSYRLEMTTGGGWARSEQTAFSIADAPTCAIDAPSTLTAQPIGFTVSSDTGDTVTATVTALGSSGTGLHGDAQQYEGDTVYTGVFTPEWVEENDERTAAIELPSGLALFDGAVYRLDVTATDADTELPSAAASAEFPIVWAHKAQQPEASITVDGAAKSATIKVDAPDDYAYGDRFDLYRVTADGERRIAQAQPFGTIITDRRAPYSYDGQNLRYIAVTRTADGDVCVSDDIGYELVGNALRFDWGDSYVELPYSISMRDSISNDSETRKHMDGESEGYAENGYSRRSELSTQLIRLGDSEQKELVRSMLQHPGSVFVRTPDGLAYAANVTPGTLERSAGGAIEAADFTAEEHALTDDDRPGEPDIAQPSWGGGEVEAHNGIVYDADGGFPMDEWVFIGYADSMLYVADPDGTVRDADGDEMVDWEFDGLTLTDENGDEVPVTEEP